MTTEEQYDNVVCPTEDELINHKICEGKLCPVIECGKSIKNPSAMRMHLAQTHGIGAENVLQTFNKAFIVANQTTKSLYACPVFTCSRTYGSGRYFKALSTLREHYLSMHAEKKHICQKCGARFGNPRRLQLHSKNCKTIFYCTCGCPFKKREALLEHTMRSQHELPEDIKQEILKKNRSNARKDKVIERSAYHSKVGCLEQPSFNAKDLQSPDDQILNTKQLIVVPQHFSNNDVIKPNAFLIVSCQDVGNSSTNSGASIPSQSVQMPFKIVQSKSFPAVNVTTFSAAPNRLDVAFRSTDSYRSNNTGDFAFSRDGSVRNGNDNFGQRLQTEIMSQGSVPLSAGFDEATNRRNAKEDYAPSVVPIKPSLAVSKNDITERNKRVDEAMKQYIPIKRKSPLDPVVSDWHCSVPRRKYKKRKRTVQGKTSSGSDAMGTSNNDESSVSSMQDCLQKASNFVKNMLPKMKSPKRRESPDHGEPLLKLPPKTGNKSPGHYETSSHVTPERSDHVNVANCLMIAKQKTYENGFMRSRVDSNVVEDNPGGAEQSSSRAIPYREELNEEMAQSPNVTVSQANGRQGLFTSDTQTNENEFNLDNLSPDMLFDIETQTEDFSNFFSDAFTQTIQKSAQLAVASSQSVSGENEQEDLENTAACWVNNNQTQTDDISQLIVDAFTQTRIDLEENDSFAIKSVQNSMSDNHTQTILSSDNFFKNFNFGTDDETLDSALMPDLIDICTQTAPDPSFDELLALCSAEVQTDNASTSM
ncbi:uncharacterized protein LOC135690527 [Rhopilema esculentum]|uniref:uncharacterized protein LOC135690527 n=1 Tax=Rhopilema esculentum TaxID=499914 RepID=UPI0031DFDAE3